MFPLLLSSSLLQLGTTEDWEAMVAENTVRIFAFKFSNILQIQTLTLQYNTNTNIRNSGSTCSIVEIGSKNGIKRQGLITTSHLPQIVNEGKVIT